jgi:radical SAM protein with 4Fe4S-binding SPASM domain
MDFDDDSYKVLLFEALIQNAFGIENKYAYLGPPKEAFEYIIIETNGDICLDEEYGQIDRYNFGSEYNLGLNVLDDDFSFFRVESVLEQVIDARALDRLPDACKSCGVKAMCRGSHPGTRFDDHNKSYNNSSVYCDVMSDLCRQVLRRICTEGLISYIRDPALRAIAEQYELQSEPDF